MVCHVCVFVSTTSFRHFFDLVLLQRFATKFSMSVLIDYSLFTRLTSIRFQCIFLKRVLHPQQCFAYSLSLPINNKCDKLKEGWRVYTCKCAMPRLTSCIKMRSKCGFYPSSSNVPRGSKNKSDRPSLSPVPSEPVPADRRDIFFLFHTTTISRTE